MPFEQRKQLISELEQIRGRRVISLLNFDRSEFPNNLGTKVQFGEDIKEPLFRVLKETIGQNDRLDLFLYTRGGELNAVWPVASVLREFDPEFEVLVPYRAHSSGTLLALAARRIVISQIGELSPIDPTTGNQFNPRDEVSKGHLAISVEDVNAYKEFLKSSYGLSNGQLPLESQKLLQPHIMQLTSIVHPIAVGNVHRTLMQIKVLAKALVRQHYGQDERVETMLNNLTTQFYSHQHMINRHEAREILGEDHVSFAEAELAQKMDQLLRSYEDDFGLRTPFFLTRYMQNDMEKEIRTIGGCVESEKWGYLYETNLRASQCSVIPDNIKLQVPPGQPFPLLPGFPRKCDATIMSRGWVRNKNPKGVAI